MMNKRIEILAPAGSYEGMRAAMNAGCDAVYIGGSSFGARAYADNQEEAALLQAIEEAHIRDKKLYLTVNTLLKEEECTGELYRFLEKFYLKGLDAVIVQDVGVLRFIHKNFPELPIHASTQMTLTMAEGANLLQDYGVTRLIPARELSLAELKHMRENTALELEVFVHGALCYCYSGQCLMSSMIGGRSGNRGRCAQPCRMPWKFYSGSSRLSEGQEKYLLSPKDLSTIGVLPKLIDAGVDSFKIEGRMKRPEYAAAVTEVYRKYTGLYLSEGREAYNERLRGEDYRKDMLLLQDSYNRGGFTEGYGRTYHGKGMMSLYRPNHSGVCVGTVSHVKEGRVSIALEEQVNPQDILEIRSQGEEGYEFTVKDAHGAGELLTTNVGNWPEQGQRRENRKSDRDGKPSKDGKSGRESGESSKDGELDRDRRLGWNEELGKDRKSDWHGKANNAIKVGDKAFRTKNNQLLEQLADKYMKRDKKQPIQGRLVAKAGEPLAFTVFRKEYCVTAYRGVVQEAQKQPMTEDKLKTALEKTGDTLFYFDRLTIGMGENIFVPVAWLNEIRREAISLLQESIAAGYHRHLAAPEIQTERATEIPEIRADNDQPASGAHTDQHSGDTEICMDRKTAGESIKLNICPTYKGGTSDSRSVGAEAAHTSPYGICVSVQSMEQLERALAMEQIDRIYAEYDTFRIAELRKAAETATSSGKEFYLSLPYICRQKTYDGLKEELSGIINSSGIHGFVVKNFEELALLRSLESDEKGKRLILNYNLYTYNSEAKSFYRELSASNRLGIAGLTAPVELTYRELAALGIEGSDLVIYGYQPVMVSAQCLYQNTEGCRKCSRGNSGRLEDRLRKSFYVRTFCNDNGCYNIIYNGQPLSLLHYKEEIDRLHPENLRLDFSRETGEELGKVITAFYDVFRNRKKPGAELTDYTTGHFKRGVE